MTVTRLIQYLSLLIFVCEFSQIVCTKQKPNYKGLSLRMIHSNSPKSPTYQPELTDLERTKKLLAMSESRMRYLTNNDTSRESVSRYRRPDIGPEMRKSNYIYYVTLGLGQFNDVNNPVHNIHLLFDTGSDLMWTQCEGCRQCFYQNSPYFPRTRSQTYQPYPCVRCPSGQCYQDHCTISNSYGDGTTTMNGILATETFTFFSQYMFDETIHGLVFACSLATSNFYAANVNDNPITGVLGMGKGQNSLISQLGRYGQYRFSYCLQDSNDHVGAYSQMLLSFGDDIGRTPIMSVTQLLTNPKRPTFYYVDLIDISVNKKRLNIPRQYFTIPHDSYLGGTIFDTGSSVSHLVSNAYDILERGIEKYVRKNNPYLKRNTNPNDYDFETCWEPLFDSPTVSFPSITFHFGNNADMVVQQDQVISTIHTPGVPNPGLYCLFISRAITDLNIIGAFQQVNQRVITDVQAMQISFAVEDCSQSTW